MPNVGGKKFAYTPEGEAAAAEYAQKTGAPFQMRAKAHSNSPMQKNFGKDLALNKDLDKDSSPLLSKGKKGGSMPTPKTGGWNKNIQSSAKTFGSNFKTSIDKCDSKIGLKKTGNIGAKLKSKYSGSAQRANKVARPGESQFQFKTRTRTRKSEPKKSKYTVSGKGKDNTNPKFQSVATGPQTAATAALNKASFPVKGPVRTKKQRAIASAKKSYGVLSSQKNKKAPATKIPSGGFDPKTGKFTLEKAPLYHLIDEESESESKA